MRGVDSRSVPAHLESLLRTFDIDFPSFDLLEYFGPATINFIFIFDFGIARDAEATSHPSGISVVSRNGCVGKTWHKKRQQVPPADGRFVQGLHPFPSAWRSTSSGSLTRHFWYLD